MGELEHNFDKNSINTDNKINKESKWIKDSLLDLKFNINELANKYEKLYKENRISEKIYTRKLDNLMTLYLKLYNIEPEVKKITEEKKWKPNQNWLN